MSNNLRQAAQQALEALEIGYDSAQAEADQYHLAMAGYKPERHAQMDADVQQIARAITALQAALAEPEQELDGISWLKRDSGYFTAPTPQREHITDGSPCWCNPDVIEEDGGNVIVHNYEDNWQQYAKPGETAQQCIERHRGEQDALMKLYATPRKPLTDEELRECWDQVGNNETVWAMRVQFARVIERAHGITGDSNE